MQFTYFDPMFNFHFATANPFKNELGHKGFICGTDNREGLLLDSKTRW